MDLNQELTPWGHSCTTKAITRVIQRIIVQVVTWNGKYPHFSSLFHRLYHPPLHGFYVYMYKYSSNPHSAARWFCFRNRKREINKLVDASVTKSAIQYLEEMAPLVKSSSKKFFALVGFRRPHISNAVPRYYFKAVGNTKSPKKFAGHDIPGAASHRQSLAFFLSSRELGDRLVFSKGAWQSMQSLNDLVDKTELRSHALVQVRKSYHAAVQWVDSRVGQLMKTLKRLDLENSTIVVFFSDHGFLNGQHGMFGKSSLYEKTLKTPLLVKVPGTRPNRKMTTSQVSLIDIFPTLVGLNEGPALDLSQESPLDGHSFARTLLEDSQEIPHRAMAFSSFPRCRSPAGGEHEDKSCTRSYDETDSCARPRVQYMGYSVRTFQGHRYTEWRPFQEEDEGCGVIEYPDMSVYLKGTNPRGYRKVASYGADWSSPPMHQELFLEDYDKNPDDWEAINYANNPNASQRRLMADLSRMIQSYFQDNQQKVECNDGKGLLKTSNQPPYQQYCECSPPWLPPNCLSTTHSPTTFPTNAPTTSPTLFPTSTPTSSPTLSPTLYPTSSPTLRPTNSPSKRPISFPTRFPTKRPTLKPTTYPTDYPTDFPSKSPLV